MKRTQLAAAVILAGGFCTHALAATYSVTPLPLDDIAQNNFGRSIDESGTMLSTVTNEYNPPVDIEQLTNDTGFFVNNADDLDSEDDVRNGIFSDADYSTIYNFLLSSRGFATGQQLANARTYVTDTVDAELVPGLDQITDKFDDYTQSVNTLARDSLNGDYIVGTSDAITVEDPYENSDGDVIDYTYNIMAQQAFVDVNGVVTRLPAENDLLGGSSHAHAINNNFQVAGYGTVSFSESVTEGIESCEDPEGRGEPEGYCKSRIYNAFSSSAVSNATIWQLDASGSIISQQTFPLVFTPEEDDENPYFSRAYGINNQGIAVGESLTGDVELILRPGNTRPQNEPVRVATVYRNGETEELLPRDENLLSVAYDINDNNWVTGYVLRASSTTARQQLFIHNLNNGASRYPDGFFVGSGVDANAINNNNIVVGKADSESTSNAGIRQTAAFMYDIQADEFTNLNDLTACDSPYTLVEAVDINDNNEIIANARVTGSARYITGAEVLNDSGEPVEQDVIVAVKLTPRPNGQIEQCDNQDEGVERQGAAISAWWLLLLGLVGFRRRR